MKREHIALIILAVSAILLIVNIILGAQENWGNGFWLRVTSNILIMAAMFLVYRGERKKQKS